MSFIKIAAFTVAGIMLVGCAKDPNAELFDIAGGGGPGYNPAYVGHDFPADVPDPVADVFFGDFPDADVFSVDPLTTETGRPFYRITFIGAGGARAASYFADGTRFYLPAPAHLGPVQLPPRRTGPRPAPRPATPPAATPSKTT